MQINDNGERVSTVTESEILGFFGEYRFLSNFEPCNVDIGDGNVYRSSEAAFMAQKTHDVNDKKKIAAMSPSEAKKYGQTVTLRGDWESYRTVAMMKALIAKFSQNPALAEKLLNTRGKYLEETNNWHDMFWGVEDDVGLNMLGHCLMLVRDDILSF